MIGRAATLACVILVAGAYAKHAAGQDSAPPRVPLAAVPCAMDGWRCGGDVPLEPDILAVLKVDDYVNRVYWTRDGRSAGLYVGYYASQRQGDTMHSPQNCLPGAGWQPISATRADLDLGGTHIPVNRYIVQKDLDRQIVVYWYEGRGRTIANEYSNKFWLMVDAARLHRSDGALVRIVVPAANGTEASLDEAGQTADGFARSLFPRLTRSLP